MTEGLQDYARLRSQTLRPKLKNIQLAVLLNKIKSSLSSRLAEKKMTIHINIPDDYSLMADQPLVERVFSNLFDNSLRYSLAKNITISATPEQIVFADDGVGIPPEYLQDVFERFFRLEKSRNRAAGGLGLGLAIVKEIIEVHGWKIHAKIPDNKIGVEFVIEL
jgi:signal transduction histidine kinase